MKTGIFMVLAAAACWVDLVIGGNHALHQHHKRQAKGELPSRPATFDRSEVIILVNEKGEPVSTTTILANKHSPTDKPRPAPQGIPPASPPPPPPPPSPPSPPSLPPSPSQGPPFPIGIGYSPYNADGTCKTLAQVTTDLAALHPSYPLLRLYGTDCDQVAHVLAATPSTTSLFAGLYSLANLASDINTLVAAVATHPTRWQRIRTVSVGNELVNSGAAMPSTVAAAVIHARSLLRAAGYTGPVVTVDTMTAIQAYPELCAASDYCAINCHAFFAANIPASQAGSYVAGWAHRIAAKAGKPTVVVESGWPSQGHANGQAVAGTTEQATALASLMQAMPTNLILFMAYDTLWKKDFEGSFGAERFWGVHGRAPTS